MLEISHRNGSYSNPLVGPRLVSAACQTEEMLSEKKPPPHQQQSPNSASFKIMSSKNQESESLCSHDDVSDGTGVKGSKNSAEQCSNSNCTSPLRTDSANSTNSSNSSSSSTGESSLVMNGGVVVQIETDNAAISSPQRPLSSASEESESSISEDDEISFNTIKRGAGLKLLKQTSNLLVASKSNPEADNVKSCDETTCSSSAVNQINLKSSSSLTSSSSSSSSTSSSSSSSVKCHGDFETGGGDNSLQTVPPLQINGGTVLHSTEFYSLHLSLDAVIS